VTAAEDQGLNEGVDTLSIPVAIRWARVFDKDEQVRQLLVQKGAFSASAIWNVCGTRVGNARVVLRAQKEQIAIDVAKTTSQTQGRVERRAKSLALAQKHNTLGSGVLTDKDWGDIVRWVLPEAKVTCLMRDLKKKDAIIAKLVTLERDWTSYIPARVLVKNDPCHTSASSKAIRIVWTQFNHLLVIAMQVDRLLQLLSVFFICNYLSIVLKAR
jgi:hypothetical protein